MSNHNKITCIKQILNPIQLISNQTIAQAKQVKTREAKNRDIILYLNVTYRIQNEKFGKKILVF